MGKEDEMYGGQFDPMQEDEPPVTGEPEPVIDYETDQIDVRDEREEGPWRDEVAPDEESLMIDNVSLDNALDEFVDLINGRDFEGLRDLLAPDVEADFLGETTREGVIEGFNDLLLRNSTLLVTRGDLGSKPIVVVWIFDFETDRFDLSGYMYVEVSESDDAVIEQISYVEELADTDDLVVESPDRTELPEWEDWSELDED